jgi:hypothetical protein
MIDAMTSETVVPRRPNGVRFAAVVLALLAVTSPAFAQGDVTSFLGGAYPVYDDRLTLRPSIPSLPDADVTVTGTPELRTNGGLVFGGAVAFEAGIIGIEGRLDATEVGFDLTGARYDVRATAPPFEGLTAAVTVGDGHFDADCLYLLSLNVRLRTPGPIGLVASGGLSYLPDVTITGAVPLSVQISGLPALPITPQVRLRVAAGESEQRFGLNGGAGLRIGGSRVALMAEIRVFYFRDYELRFDVDDAPDIVGDLLDGINAIRFEPVIVNAQAGLVFKF